VAGVEATAAGSDTNEASSWKTSSGALTQEMGITAAELVRKASAVQCTVVLQPSTWVESTGLGSITLLGDVSNATVAGSGQVCFDRLGISGDVMEERMSSAVVQCNWHSGQVIQSRPFLLATMRQQATWSTGPESDRLHLDRGDAAEAVSAIASQLNLTAT